MTQKLHINFAELAATLLVSKYGIGNYSFMFQIVGRIYDKRRLSKVLQQHMSFCWKQPYFRRPLKYHLFKCIYDESFKCKFLYHLDEVQFRQTDFKTSNKMVKLVTVNTLLDDMCTSTTATVSLLCPCKQLTLEEYCQDRFNQPTQILESCIASMHIWSKLC